MQKIILPIFIIFLVLSGTVQAECIQGNCRNATGVYLFPDGSRYEGMFKNTRIEGDGTLTYADKSRYTGSFVGGVPHGQGAIVYPDGSTYRGNFDNGTMSGKGILRNADGSSYEGDFLAGMFHGQGTYTFPDGREYKGEFKDGLFDGLGTLTTAESVLTIQFKEGKCMGYGTIILSEDKTQLTGKCKNGEFVYSKKGPLPKTDAAAEKEPDEPKKEGELEFKEYKPENFYVEPAAATPPEFPDLGDVQQPLENQPLISEYKVPGTDSHEIQ